MSSPLGQRSDVSKEADVRAAVEQLDSWGGLDVIFNNAGIMRGEDLAAPEVDIGEAEATVATNLLGPMRLTAALLPHLRSRPRAAVLNVTSGLAFVPLAHTPAYSASKAALHSWTQSLRAQLRGSSVEVIEIAPPQVATELMPGQSRNPRAMLLEDFVSDDDAGELPLDQESIEMMLGIDASMIEVISTGGSQPSAAMMSFLERATPPCSSSKTAGAVCAITVLIL